MNSKRKLGHKLGLIWPKKLTIWLNKGQYTQQIVLLKYQKESFWQSRQDWDPLLEECQRISLGSLSWETKIRKIIWNCRRKLLRLRQKMTKNLQNKERSHLKGKYSKSYKIIGDLWLIWVDLLLITLYSPNISIQRIVIKKT